MAQLFSPPFQTTLDANARPISGALLYFYLTGTLTPATAYQDNALTTPHAQPIVADAAGRFAPVYLDTVVSYRVRVCDSVGTIIRDVDPITQSTASGLITSFGADGSGALPSSTAITNALTAGSAIVPAGTFLAHGLTMATDGRRLDGLGLASINRDLTGSMLTIPNADTVVSNIQFNGLTASGYAGDLCTITGSRAKLFMAAFRDAGTYNAVKTTGSRTLILSDHDSYNGNVLFMGPGGGANAMTYSNIAFAHVTGQMQFVDTGFCTAVSCLLGGLLIDTGVGSLGGQGAKVLSTRIVGNATITQSSAYIGAGSAISGNVTIGDGVTTYTGITIDPSFLNDQSIATTVWIKDHVEGSTFYLDQLMGGLSTVTLSNLVRQKNSIYHRSIAFVPTFTTGGGAFALGNGTLGARFSQQGNIIEFTIVLLLGSTTSVGTGQLSPTLPVPINSAPFQGLLTINDADGPFLSNFCYTVSGGAPSAIVGVTAAGAVIGATAPIILATGDQLTWSGSYAL